MPKRVCWSLLETQFDDTIFGRFWFRLDVLKASAIAYINAGLGAKENVGEIGHTSSYRDLPDA